MSQQLYNLTHAGKLVTSTIGAKVINATLITHIHVEQQVRACHGALAGTSLPADRPAENTASLGSPDDAGRSCIVETEGIPIPPITPRYSESGNSGVDEAPMTLAGFAARDWAPHAS